MLGIKAYEGVKIVLEGCIQVVSGKWTKEMVHTITIEQVGRCKLCNVI